MPSNRASRLLSLFCAISCAVARDESNTDIQRQQQQQKYHREVDNEHELPNPTRPGLKRLRAKNIEGSSRKLQEDDSFDITPPPTTSGSQQHLLQNSSSITHDLLSMPTMLLDTTEWTDEAEIEVDMSVNLAADEQATNNTTQVKVHESSGISEETGEPTIDDGSKEEVDYAPHQFILQQQHLRNHLFRKRKRNRRRNKDKKDKKKKQPGGRRPKDKTKPKKKKKKKDKSSSSEQANNNRPQSQQNNQPSSSNNNQRSCFSVATYNSIDADIARLQKSITNDKDRVHFLGGIVRLVAHDFMDYDRRNLRDPFGSDGCFDVQHASNAGLDTIWCKNCELTRLHRDKYDELSRADFWIASANAVLHQTSVNNELDMTDDFVWGREDRDTCRGSGDRLPTTEGCDQIEKVFLRNMGLTWKDSVALLGAHSIGLGDSRFSGHEGTWTRSLKDAQVFDSGYYTALLDETWRPRNMGDAEQDWTTGRDNDNPRMMLNTDICLVHDIKENVDRDIPCCSRTNHHFEDGQNECMDREAARQRCPMYSRGNPAANAVHEMKDDNAAFYRAFTRAWNKATTVGHKNLNPLDESC